VIALRRCRVCRGSFTSSRRKCEWCNSMDTRVVVE